MRAHVLAHAVVPDGFAQATMIDDGEVILTVSKYDGGPVVSLIIPVDQWDQLIDTLFSVRIGFVDLVPTTV